MAEEKIVIAMDDELPPPPTKETKIVVAADDELPPPIAPLKKKEQTLPLASAYSLEATKLPSSKLPKDAMLQNFQKSQEPKAKPIQDGSVAQISGGEVPQIANQELVSQKLSQRIIEKAAQKKQKQAELSEKMGQMDATEDPIEKASLQAQIDADTAEITKLNNVISNATNVNTKLKKQNIGEIDAFMNAIERGVGQGEIADILAAGKTPTMQEIKRIAEIKKGEQNLPSSKAYEDFSNVDGAMNAAKEFIKNPFEITSQLVTESLVAMVRHGYARAAVGAGEGAVMGSVLPGVGTLAGLSSGYIAGMGVAGLNLEMSSAILESLQNAGIDVTDAESLQSGIYNIEKMDAARSFALKRGVPIAIFDMLSAGVAGKLLSKPAKSLLGKATKGAAEIGVQAGMAGGGELAAQAISGQKINTASILGEMIGEGGGGVQEIAIGTMIEKKKQGKDIKEDIAKIDVPKEQFDKMVDISEGAGQITEQQADEIKQEHAEVKGVEEEVEVKEPTIATEYLTNEGQGLTEKNKAIFDKVQEMTDSPEEAEHFQERLDAEVELGKITPEEADQLVTLKDNIVEIQKEIPDNIQGDMRLASVNILAENNTIEKSIEGKNESLVQPQKEQLKRNNEALTAIANGATIEEVELIINPKEQVVETPKEEIAPITEDINQLKTQEDAATTGKIEQGNQSEYQGTTEQQQGEQTDRNNQEAVITQIQTETGGGDSVIESGQVQEITPINDGGNSVVVDKSDVDIENRMTELEGAKIGTPELAEFNALEKEMEKRERNSVFNVPLEKVNDTVDALMQKEKEQPNGYGSFIEKRDARETKEVADRYLNAKELTDAELKKDFSDAVRGNPTTWYADGLKMRESLKEATNRGIDTKDMLAEVTKVYTDAGYDIETAKSVVAGMLKPVFEGSQKVNEKQIPEQSLKEQPKAETKEEVKPKREAKIPKSLQKENLFVPAESRKDQVLRAVQQYNSLGTREQQGAQGVALMKEIQGGIKNLEYSLQPLKGGGYSLLNNEGKIVKKESVFRPKEEVQAEKDQKAKENRARNADPQSLYHAIAQLVSSGEQFDAKEIRDLLGENVAKEIPFGYTKNGGTRLEFIKQKMAEMGLGDVNAGETEMSLEDKSQIEDAVKDFMIKGGRKEATDYVVKQQEKIENQGMTDEQIARMQEQQVEETQPPITEAWEEETTTQPTTDEEAPFHKADILSAQEKQMLDFVNLNPDFTLEEVKDNIIPKEWRDNGQINEAVEAAFEKANRNKKVGRNIHNALVNRIQKGLQKLFGNADSKVVTFDTEAELMAKAKELGGGQFQIIGEQGASQLSNNEKVVSDLVVAKIMESESKAPKEIRLLTGWEKGKDGKWRYEIPYAKYKDENAVLDAIENNKKGIKITDLIDAKELFEAHPELKEITINFDENLKDNELGNYNQKTKEITFNTRKSNSVSSGKDKSSAEGKRRNLHNIRETLIHELQHGVQSREGFIGGSNYTRAFLNLFDRYQKEIDLELAKRENLSEIEKEIFTYSYIVNKENAINIKQAIHNEYQKHLGEVEARVASNRMNLSEEERQNTLISETFNKELSKDGRKTINEALSNDDIQFMKDPSGKVLGFTHNGNIYLNGEHINANTPIHEAGHIWLNFIEVNNPELHARGIKLIEGTKYLAEVERNPFYQKQAEQQGLKRGTKEYNDFMKNEALARAIGDEGEKMVSAAKKSEFKEWLNNLWKEVKSLLGIRDLSPTEIGNLTMEEFAKRAAADVLQKFETKKAPDTTLSPSERLKSLSNRVLESDMSDEARKIVEDNGLKYEQMSNEVSDEIAKGIIEAEGIKGALEIARDKNSDIAGSVRTLIFANAINDAVEQESKATTAEDKTYYANQQAELINELDNASRDAGRQIQAISRFYKMSPLGIKQAEINKLERNKDAILSGQNPDSTKKSNVNKEEQPGYKIEEALKELDELKNRIEEQVEKGINEELNKLNDKSFNDKVDKATAELIEKIKKQTYLSLIPPPVLIGAIKAVGYGIKAGYSIAQAVERGIKHIRDNYNGTFDEKKFTDLAESHYKQYGISVKGKKSKSLQDEQMTILNKYFPQTTTENLSKTKTTNEKILEQYNAGVLEGKTYTDKKGRAKDFQALFYNKLGIIDPNNPEIKAKLKEFSERAAKAPTGSTFQRQALKDMADYLANLKKTSLIEAGMSVWYANILSSYETHLRNLEFNAISTVITQPSMLLAKAIAKKKPKDFVKIWSALTGGFSKGAEEGRSIILDNVNSKYDDSQTSAFLDRVKKEGFAKAILGRQYIGRALRAGDVLFTSPLVEAKSYEQILKRVRGEGKVTDDTEAYRLTDEIMGFNANTIEEAQKQALNESEVFFGKDEAKGIEENIKNEKTKGYEIQYPKEYRAYKIRVGEIIEQGRLGRLNKVLPVKSSDDIAGQAKDWAKSTLLTATPPGNWAGVANAITTLGGSTLPVKFLVPFVNVPLNATAMLIKRSPLGFVNAIRGKEGFGQTYERKMSKDEQQEAYTRAVSYSTALVLLGGAMKFGMDDDEPEKSWFWVTGKLHGNYAKNEELKKQKGLEEYSVYMWGQKIMSYRTSPLASVLLPLGIMGDSKVLDKDPDKENLAMATLTGSMMFAIDQTSLRGLSSSLDFIKDDGSALDKSKKAGAKFLQALVIPYSGTLKAINEDATGAMNYLMGDKYVQHKSVTATDALVNGIPFVEKIAPVKKDIFGQPVYTEFDMPLLPIMHTYSDTKQKLFAKKGYSKPNFIKGKTVSIGGEEIPVTETQVYQINNMRGELVEEFMTKHFKELEELKNYDFSKIMNTVFNEAKAKAQETITGIELEKKEKAKMEDSSKGLLLKAKAIDGKVVEPKNTGIKPHIPKAPNPPRPGR